MSRSPPPSLQLGGPRAAVSSSVSAAPISTSAGPRYATGSQENIDASESSSSCTSSSGTASSSDKDAFHTPILVKSSADYSTGFPKSILRRPGEERRSPSGRRISFMDSDATETSEEPDEESAEEPTLTFESRIQDVLDSDNGLHDEVPPSASNNNAVGQLSKAPRAEEEAYSSLADKESNRNTIDQSSSGSDVAYEEPRISSSMPAVEPSRNESTNEMFSQDSSTLSLDNCIEEAKERAPKPGTSHSTPASTAKQHQSDPCNSGLSDTTLLNASSDTAPPSPSAAKAVLQPSNSQPPLQHVSKTGKASQFRKTADNEDTEEWNLEPSVGRDGTDSMGSESSTLRSDGGTAPDELEQLLTESNVKRKKLVLVTRKRRKQHAGETSASSHPSCTQGKETAAQSTSKAVEKRGRAVRSELDKRQNDLAVPNSFANSERRSKSSRARLSSQGINHFFGSNEMGIGITPVDVKLLPSYKTAWEDESLSSADSTCAKLPLYEEFGLTSSYSALQDSSSSPRPRYSSALHYNGMPVFVASPVVQLPKGGEAAPEISQTGHYTEQEKNIVHRHHVAQQRHTSANREEETEKLTRNDSSKRGERHQRSDKLAGGALSLHGGEWRNTVREADRIRREMDLITASLVSSNEFADRNTPSISLLLEKHNQTVRHAYGDRSVMRGSNNPKPHARHAKPELKRGPTPGKLSSHSHRYEEKHEKKHRVRHSSSRKHQRSGNNRHRQEDRQKHEKKERGHHHHHHHHHSQDHISSAKPKRKHSEKGKRSLSARAQHAPSPVEDARDPQVMIEPTLMQEFTPPPPSDNCTQTDIYGEGGAPHPTETPQPCPSFDVSGLVKSPSLSRQAAPVSPSSGDHEGRKTMERSREERQDAIRKAVAAIRAKRNSSFLRDNSGLSLTRQLSVSSSELAPAQQRPIPEVTTSAFVKTERGRQKKIISPAQEPLVEQDSRMFCANNDKVETKAADAALAVPQEKVEERRQPNLSLFAAPLDNYPSTTLNVQREMDRPRRDYPRPVACDSLEIAVADPKVARSFAESVTRITHYLHQCRSGE